MLLQVAGYDNAEPPQTAKKIQPPPQIPAPERVTRSAASGQGRAGIPRPARKQSPTDTDAPEPSATQSHSQTVAGAACPNSAEALKGSRGCQTSRIHLITSCTYALGA